jgi:hypothetical protein
MSGGRWSFAQTRIMGLLHEITDDDETAGRWLALHEVLWRLGDALYVMDWDLSDDARIPDDAAWERQALERLRKAMEYETGLQ